MAVAMITAAVAAAGALLNISRENSAATAELEQYGRQRAALEMDAAAKQQNLVGQVAIAAEMHQNQTLSIEQQRMELEAEASVAASTAGVAGSSVDVGAVEIDAAAGRKQGNVEKALQNSLRQLDQASRDIEIQKEAGIAEIDTLDTRGQLAGVFLEGLRGFVGAGGFGE